jgi:glycosyltransferase involved in cell wall biosynthesis
MNMKKLLIVTTNFPPSKSIGTQRVLRILKYLDRSKWDVTVLTLKEHYYPEYTGKPEPLPEFLNDVKIYRTGKIDLVFYLLNLRKRLFKSGSGATEKPSENKVNVTKKVPQNGKEKLNIEVGWKPAEQLAKRSKWQVVKDFFTDIFQFPDKHITMLPLAVWRGYRIIRKHKIDVVFSTSPPHSLHLISGLLKKLTGVKMVIDFRDPWARSPWHDEERTANRFETWKHNKIVAFERWVVKNADRVVLITKEMYEDFRGFYSDLPSEKFALFNNGFDPENLKLFETSQINVSGDKEKIRFIHAGSLYKHRDPTPILLALKNLLDKGEIDRDRIEFIFLGAVTDHQKHTKALSEQLGLSDVVKFISKVSYVESLAYMAQSDILILLQPVTKLQLPGKFYDYICWDKPIFAVAEEGSATKNAVVDQFGIFSNFNDIGDIEKGIRFLYENPTYLIEQIRENRNFYNMEKSISRFTALLEN